MLKTTNHAYRTLCVCLVALTALATSARAQTDPGSSADLLAVSLVRTAHQLLEEPMLSRPTMEGSLLILQQAAKLRPHDPELWRSIRSIAELAENQELRSQAIARIVELDPSDQMARLMRLNDALERYQTVEERTAAYETLLSPQNRERIGAAVVSRLASDLALLYQRQGDTDAYAHWLSESIGIDPSNRSAVSMAVGFFRMNVDDPYAEAELLVSLLLADPTNEIVTIALAALLLEHGAYKGAARMHGLATATQKANYRQISGDLLADRAIALWAIGKDQEALDLIEEEQQLANLFARRAAIQQMPDLKPQQVMMIRGAIEPALATVRAAIHNRRGSEHAADWLKAAAESYDQLGRSELQKEKPDSFRIAFLALEASWVATWLGSDAEYIGRFMQIAERINELTPKARARFGGWLAMKAGKYDDAAELFSFADANDDAVRLGKAVLLSRQDRPDDAANALFEFVRSRPGTLMGVWAMDLLREQVGRRPAPSPLAQKLDELIATIPLNVDRMPENPTLSLRLSIKPAQDNFPPFTPTIINLEMTNLTRFPLAIDPAGPIKPQVWLIPTVRISRVPQVSELEPMIVDINRLLRIEPLQTLVVPVDLRRHKFNDYMNLLPSSGASVEVRAISNPAVVSQGALKPTMLGVDTRSSIFRIDGERTVSMREGERTSMEWIRQIADGVRSDNDSVSLTTYAMAAIMVGGLLEQRVRPDDMTILRDAADAFTEKYAKLNPIEQAWLISILPVVPSLDPMMQIARVSEDRWVQFAHLLYRTRGPDDAMLAAAKRREDPDVRRLAEIIEKVQKIAADAAAASAASASP